MEIDFFEKIEMTENWKSDESLFLKAKARYAALIGCLQGMKYMIDHAAIPNGEEILQKAYAEIEESLQEICGEMMNCGQLGGPLPLNWIIEDDFLQFIFPIKNEEGNNGF